MGVFGAGKPTVGAAMAAPGEIPITVEIVEGILGVLYLAARKPR